MKKLVTKHNNLIEASYRLSLNEARILFYGISLINPLSDDFPLEYVIDVKDFAKMFNIESNNVYKVIKETVMDKFWEREFTFPTEDDRKKRYRWLISIEYGDKEGYLKVFFHPQIQPFLRQLKKNFTSYYLEKIAHFKSIYSVRFYEMSIMHLKRSESDRCKFVLTINDIKERLGVSNKYPRFSNFKATVLEKAKKEINKYSDMNISYKVTKRGRVPNEIHFTVSMKTDDLETVKTKAMPTDYQMPTWAIEDAKKILREAGTRWDVYQLLELFYENKKRHGWPSHPPGAFVGYAKKKVEVAHARDLMRPINS